MGEKKWKSLLQLLIFLTLALTPYLLKISINDEISNSSKTYLETILMTEDFESDIKIIDGQLQGNQSFSIAIEEAVIFINPLNQTLSNEEYKYLPVYEFKENGITISLMDNVINEFSYDEVGCSSLDFNKIFKSDYIEFHSFISVINHLYNGSKGYINTLNYFSMLIMNYISIIFSAAIIALFGGVANKVVGYKFRFKGALDAQFISIVFIFLSHLFDFAYLELIGMLFSIAYFMRGIMSIVRIEVRKIKKEE